MKNNEKPRSNFMLWIMVALAITVSISTSISLFRSGSGYLSQGEGSTRPTEVQQEDAQLGIFRLERIGRDGNFEFYRDPVTDVLYLRLAGYKESGIAAMLDPETGLPLTYARYMEFYNQHLDEAQ